MKEGTCPGRLRPTSPMCRLPDVDADVIAGVRVSAELVVEGRGWCHLLCKAWAEGPAVAPQASSPSALSVDPLQPKWPQTALLSIHTPLPPVTMYGAGATQSSEAAGGHSRCFISLPRRLASLKGTGTHAAEPLRLAPTPGDVGICVAARPPPFKPRWLPLFSAASRDTTSRRSSPHPRVASAAPCRRRLFIPCLPPHSLHHPPPGIERETAQLPPLFPSRRLLLPRRMRQHLTRRGGSSVSLGCSGGTESSATCTSTPWISSLLSTLFTIAESLRCSPQ